MSEKIFSCQAPVKIIFAIRNDSRILVGYGPNFFCMLAKKFSLLSIFLLYKNMMPMIKINIAIMFIIELPNNICGMLIIPIPIALLSIKICIWRFDILLLPANIFFTLPLGLHFVCENRSVFHFE